MMTVRYGLILLILFLTAHTSADTLPEKDSNAALQTTVLGGFVIKSRSAVLEIRERAITFDKEVTALRQDLTLNCDKIRVYLNERSEDNGAQGRDSIDRIVATGNVIITRPDGLLGTAEEAVYDLNQDKAVMTGQPIFKQANNSFEGSRMTFLNFGDPNELENNEERIIMEGPVSAFLHDNGIYIDSESFEMDNKKRMFVFAGEVELRKEDMTMNCERMLGYYHEGPGRESGNAESIMGDIDEIIATGRVKITRPDGLVGTTEKAVYDLNQEKVVMTGQPVFKQGNDSFEAFRITYDLKEERILGEGSKEDKAKKVFDSEGDLVGRP